VNIGAKLLEKLKLLVATHGADVRDIFPDESLYN